MVALAAVSLHSQLTTVMSSVYQNSHLTTAISSVNQNSLMSTVMRSVNQGRKATCIVDQDLADTVLPRPSGLKTPEGISLFKLTDELPDLITSHRDL